MRLSAREEIVVELFRSLDIEQRNEQVRKMRALVDANRITQTKLKKPLKVVGNARIEAKYGLPTPRRRKPPLSSRPIPRRPDRAQDDSQGEI